VGNEWLEDRGPRGAALHLQIITVTWLTGAMGDLGLAAVGVAAVWVAAVGVAAVGVAAVWVAVEVAARDKRGGA
jgi:hypothetical protein